MSRTAVKYLRLELNAQENDWFKLVKMGYGVRSDTECLRRLIKEKYDMIKKGLEETLDEVVPQAKKEG